MRSAQVSCLLRTVWLIALSAAVLPTQPATAASADNRPAIALVIDDLGNQRQLGLQTIALPGPVTCAFLPFGPFTASLAKQARNNHKEIMLHLPMQALDHTHGPVEQGTLTIDMSEQQFQRALTRSIEAVPYVSGVNNHKGSMLTQHPGSMAWLMRAINERGDLFFVDSRTTSETVAQQLANEHGVPAIARNVFLDNRADRAAVRQQFKKLLAIAKRDGTALGIGHPLQVTLDVLAEELPRLEQHGVQLLPVSGLIKLQHDRRLAWHRSSSR